MSRWWIRSVSTAVLAVTCAAGVAQAQSAVPNILPSPGAPAADSQFQTAQHVAPAAAAPAGAQYGYVRLNAPMYPSPKPNVPIWTGSTMITNQAFAPHEMLYPHTYKAMYPPFYHRVKGKYFWTPLGMRTHEHWQLQGTTVEVKYRSKWPHLFGPHKPHISYLGGPWK